MQLFVFTSFNSLAGTYSSSQLGVPQSEADDGGGSGGIGDDEEDERDDDEDDDEDDDDRHDHKNLIVSNSLFQSCHHLVQVALQL